MPVSCHFEGRGWWIRSARHLHKHSGFQDCLNYERLCLMKTNRGGKIVQLIKVQPHDLILLPRNPTHMEGGLL